MNHTQTVAICNALKYIITEIVPVPKTTVAKRKRTELLQGLTNAARAPKEADAEAPRKASAATDEPAPIGRLEVAMVHPPPGETAKVRPGTVKSLTVNSEQMNDADQSESRVVATVIGVRSVAFRRSKANI